MFRPAPRGVFSEFAARHRPHAPRGSGCERVYSPRGRARVDHLMCASPTPNRSLKWNGWCVVNEHYELDYELYEHQNEAVSQY